MAESTSRISVQEAAHRTGVHVDTIRRYISQGRLTGYRLGKRLIRVDQAELDALMTPIPTVRSGGDAA